VRHNVRSLRGFTLIELLIALTLVSLIVSLLFGSLRLASRSWDAVDRRADHSAEMRQVWRFLHDRLGQTREVIIEQEGEEKHAVFYGNDQTLEFVSPMPAHLGVAGLYVMRLHAGRDGGLTLTRWLYHPEILEGPDGIPEWQPLVKDRGDPGKGPEGMRAYYSQSAVLDQLKRLELEYYGIAEGESDPEWLREWEEPTLPLLVRMRIEDARGAWPEMVFGVAQ